MTSISDRESGSSVRTKLNDLLAQAPRILGTSGLTSGLAVTVGTGGDYSTLGAALAAMSSYGVAYASGGVTATATILSGTTISEQLDFRAVDLGWVRILSEDATVTIDRSALTTATDVEPNDGSAAAEYPFMLGRQGAKLPRISCQFEMDTSGTASGRHGILLLTGASVVVDPDCGVNNAGGQGIYGYRAGPVVMDGAHFENAGTGWSADNGRGGWFRYCAHVSADYAVVDGANWTGLQFQATPFSARHVQAHDCKHYGVRARGGAAGSFYNADIQRSYGHGININEGATVDLGSATVTRCGETDGEPAVLIESSDADIGDMVVSGQYNGVIECRAGRTSGAPASIDANAAGGSPTNVHLRATRGGQILGQTFTTDGFTTNIPYNVQTALGVITDHEAKTGSATIASAEITATHAMILVTEESASLRTVDTVNLPFETPDGTEFTFFSADNGDPISFQGDASGNLRFHGNDTLTTDNADANTNYSIVTVKRFAGSQVRLYEKGWHQR